MQGHGISVQFQRCMIASVVMAIGREADMNEFYDRPVPRDHVRVEALLGGRKFSQDILIDDLPNQLLQYESILGHDAQRMATLRGTNKGSEIVMGAIKRSGDEYNAYDV